MSIQSLWRAARLVVSIVVFILAGMQTAAAYKITEGEFAGTDLNFYGQINRMLRYGSDGDHSDFQQLDNGTNQTRVGIAASTTSGYGPIQRWGANYELGITSNLSTYVPLKSSGPYNVSQSPFQTRIAEVWGEGRWGKLSLGQGNGAARFAGRTDLSGTQMTNGNDFRGASATQFRDSSGIARGDVDDVFHFYEGLRDDRVRYDLPTWQGLSASVSMGTDQEREFGLTYGDTVGAHHNSFDESSSYADSSWYHRWYDSKVAASLGYSENIDINSVFPNSTSSGYSILYRRQLAASASILHPSGFNLTAAYGRQSPIGIPAFTTSTINHNNNSAWYLKGGYRFGSHAFSIDYGRSEGVRDPQFTDEKVNGMHWGAGYNWEMGAYDLYGGIRQFKMERHVAGASDPHAIDTVTAGVRMRF
ncbi:MAG TPA: porin [Candidatus Acidoferrum sp.]|nr:porin [Candidatus Acidoferrum sp.]